MSDHYTEIIYDKKTLEWVIPKSKLYPTHEKDTLWSPIFSTNLNGIKKGWRLKLLPRNQECTYFDVDCNALTLGLYLANVMDVNESVSVTVMFKFFTFNVKKEMIVLWYTTIPQIFRDWTKKECIPPGLALKELMNGYKVINSICFDRNEILRNLHEDHMCFKLYCEVTEISRPIIITRNKCFIEIPRETPDVTLVAADGKEFYVHKKLLLERSPIFAGIFASIEEEKDAKEGGNKIDMTAINPAVINKMLQYIYTDTVTDFDAFAIELLKIANQYSLDGLKTICINTLQKGINVDNLRVILSLAAKHHCQQLYLHAMHFTVENHEEVINSSVYRSMEEARDKRVNQWLWKDKKNYHEKHQRRMAEFEIFRSMVNRQIW